MVLEGSKSILMVSVAVVFTAFSFSSLMAEPSLIRIAPNAIDWKMETSWESGYYSQGRDNLDGADLSTVLVDFEEDKIAGGFWFGQSPQADYEEYQAFLAYTETLGAFDISLGLAQVQILGTDESDQEIGFSFATTEGLFGVSIVLDTYYSFAADGWFGELSLSRHLEYFEDFHYEVSAILGYNMGYIRDGHLGFNHAEVAWGFEYHVNPRISVVGYSAFSWALGTQLSCDGDKLFVQRYAIWFSHSGWLLKKKQESLTFIHLIPIANSFPSRDDWMGLRLCRRLCLLETNRGSNPGCL